MVEVQSYRDLVVWQKAMDLVVMVYAATESFPKNQQYGLTAQVQRSAVSVPSNIAEGRTRHSANDFIYHLNIARGSLAEIETQLTIAHRLDYLSEIDHERLLKHSREIMMMLHGLRTSIEKPKLKPVT